MTNVGVKSTFSVHGKTVHCFESNPSQPVVTQNAADTVGSNKEDNKYDHRYTGRHDHGQLPDLKSGGAHGELVQALLDAKADSDEFLTGLIKSGQSGNAGNESGKGAQYASDTKHEESSRYESGPTEERGAESSSQFCSPSASQASQQPAKRPRA